MKQVTVAEREASDSNDSDVWCKKAAAAAVKGSSACSNDPGAAISDLAKWIASKNKLTTRRGQ